MRYLYTYPNNIEAHYDLKPYDTKEDVKTIANEINLTNFLTVTDLKDKWISVDNFKKLTKIDKINNYQYIIDNLEKNNGIITFGYQPYFKKDEILGYMIRSWDFKINKFANPDKLFASWEKQQSNKTKKQDFLEWLYEVKNQGFYSNSYDDDAGIFDFSLTKLPNNNLELLKLDLEHINKTDFFKAKTIDEIDFKNNEVKNIFKRIVLKWKSLFEKVKVKVNIFPLLISKSLAKKHGLDDLTLKYDKVNKTVDLYYVVDYFTNLTKNLIFTNSLNNVIVEEKGLIKFSHFNSTELNNFVGIFDKDNDYSTRNMLKAKDIKPIFNGQINNQVFFGQSRYSVKLINYILIIVIVFSVIGCFLQLTVVLNIIIRENIKYINTFKILGYSKLCIFNRLFLMYLPIIVIAYVFAIPLGILICFISQKFMIHNTVVYTAVNISWINFLISAVAIFIIYMFSYMISMSYARKKYPIYQVKND